MRLSVQPAATATLAAPPQRHRPGRPWQKSLVGPGDVARLLRRPTQLALPPASDSHLGPHSNPAGNPGADAHAPRSPQSPVAFARDVLGVDLWHKQDEVLKALAYSRRVAVKSGNGLGKGFCAAVAVLWFIHTHPEGAIVLTTAPTFRQVRHILWRQIHRLYRPAAQTLGGTMFDTRWELSAERYALGLSADGADQFQGFHSPNVFIVVDEAEGVSDEIYEGIESVMTSADPLLLLIGNPTTMSGAFRRAFHEERSIYHTITISALDSPNVRAGRVVVPGLTTTAWVEERRQIWGEESNIYHSRVLAEFPDQATHSLFSLRDIEAAVNRPLPDAHGTDEVVLGVDVARYGDDRSVILRRRGNLVEDIQVFHQVDTMELAAHVAAAIRQHNPDRVHIDEIGIGSGVVDRLRELGHRVRGVNVARKALHPEGYANLRSEGFWNLRQRFETGRIAIPSDNQLISELATLTFRYNSDDRIGIDGKNDIRKRSLPSPDKADALMLAFLPPIGRFQLYT